MSKLINNIKQDHERAIGDSFLFLYNRFQRSNLEFLKLGDPLQKEPDCIYSDNVAIELVDVYDNDYQAEKMWSIARGKNVSQKPKFQLLTLENLVPEIGKKLYKLEAGNYDGFSGKIILVCNLSSPLIDSNEIEKYTRTYKSFRNGGRFDRYFYEIWLRWQPNGNTNWEIKKLE